MSEDHALLTLYQINGVGTATILSLKAQFGSCADSLANDPSTWNVQKVIQRNASSFLQNYSLDSFLSALDQKQVQWLTWDHPSYPESLKQIGTPPAVLFAKGNLTRLKDPCLAVVGTRHPTPYAQQVIDSIIPGLVVSGRTIVSGFQRGVDQLAHQSCLNSRGYTIAVLGTGIDVDYPSYSQKLYHEILEHGGLVISEFLPGTPPDKGNFPRRNRIVSGLSSAVIIIEAALKSGSLVTASHALEQGKDVYAVPGSIFSAQSAGCNYLIKEGARPLLHPSNLFENIPAASFQPTLVRLTPTNLVGWKKELYEFLNTSTPSLDDCIERFQRPVSDLLLALSEFELQGLVTKYDNGTYGIIRI